jgi:hypothetical protein
VAVCAALALFVWLALTCTGCSTPQQAAYTTLGTSAETLKAASAGWLAYVQAHHGEAGLVDEAIKVKAKVDQIGSALNIAIDVAGNGSPTPANLATDLADTIALINSFKK